MSDKSTKELEDDIRAFERWRSDDHWKAPALARKRLWRARVIIILCVMGGALVFAAVLLLLNAVL